MILFTTLLIESAAFPTLRAVIYRGVGLLGVFVLGLKRRRFFLWLGVFWQIAGRGDLCCLHAPFKGENRHLRVYSSVSMLSRATGFLRRAPQVWIAISCWPVCHVCMSVKRCCGIARRKNASESFCLSQGMSGPRFFPEWGGSDGLSSCGDVIGL